MTACKTCELVARRDQGMAPLWDCILRTEYWDLVHCYETALPGWLVLVARRHMAAIDELNEAEAAELGPLLRRTSAAPRAVTSCLKTYVMQFAESPQHPHVHFIRLAFQPAEVTLHSVPGPGPLMCFVTPVTRITFNHPVLRFLGKIFEWNINRYLPRLAEF